MSELWPSFGSNLQLSTVLICGSEHRTVSWFFLLGGSLHSDPGRWYPPSSKPPGNTAEKHRRPLAKLWTGLELLLASWSGQEVAIFSGKQVLSSGQWPGDTESVVTFQRPKCHGTSQREYPKILSNPQRKGGVSTCGLPSSHWKPQFSRGWVSSWVPANPTCTIRPPTHSYILNTELALKSNCWNITKLHESDFTLRPWFLLWFRRHSGSHGGSLITK